MQRTMLSSPSIAEVTITGRSRSCRSDFSCSRTCRPFISGISMSSSSRSKGSRRSISSATRPFSASATLCPCNSQRAREQQPVDLVVVDDQQACAALSHGAASFSAAAARAYSASSASRRAASCGRVGAHAGRVPGRAPARPASVHRRYGCSTSANARHGGSGRRRRRQRAARSSASIAGASCRKVSTSSTTKSAPGGGLQFGVAVGSMAGVVMSCSLAWRHVRRAPRPAGRRGSACVM